jgi:hypothetical protein
MGSIYAGFTAAEGVAAAGMAAVRAAVAVLDAETSASMAAGVKTVPAVREAIWACKA